jgi:hypothetical protein
MRTKRPAHRTTIFAGASKRAGDLRFCRSRLWESNPRATHCEGRRTPTPALTTCDFAAARLARGRCICLMGRRFASRAASRGPVRRGDRVRSTLGSRPAPGSAAPGSPTQQRTAHGLEKVFADELRPTGPARRRDLRQRRRRRTAALRDHDSAALLTVGARYATLRASEPLRGHEACRTAHGRS